MKKSILIYFGIALVLASCYPQGPDYYEDLDVVLTDFDDSYDFASKGTYSIPDNIVKITGNLADGEIPEFVKEPFNNEMLSLIESNMASLGWTKVDDPATADVVMFPAVWTNTTVYYWYNYWCFWYPYYCGWGWGYPTVSSYTTGTLVMTLVADGDEYVDPTRVWTGALNGLLSGAYDITRVTAGINQAFAQSPYLKTN